MSKILKKGEVAAMYRGKVMALRWRDKKYVNMLSTIHDDSTVEIVVRGKKAVKPQVCFDYNDKMGGVDLSDAYLASYPSARKRLKKYYKKQFRHIMDMATFNAYLLYKKCGGEWSRLKFILILVDRLIETYTYATPTNATPTNNKSKRILCARNATKLCVFHLASKFTIPRKTIELVPIEAYNISWEIICLLYNFLCLYRSYGSCIIYTAKVKSTKSRCSVIELHKLINR